MTILDGIHLAAIAEHIDRDRFDAAELLIRRYVDFTLERLVTR